MVTASTTSEVSDSLAQPAMSGNSGLLLTKLYIPPLRSRDITRTHLLRKLNADDQAQLILISAPAGFGKTTLVAEWFNVLNQIPNGPRGVWVALEESENDQGRFWRYLVTACRQVSPQIGQRLDGLLSQSPTPSAETWLPVFIHDLASLGRPVLIALDDYHHIHNRTIHQNLSFFLNHLPSSMRVVMVTRADPPLPLARLRVEGGLVELRASDLRFTLEEIGRFLNDISTLDLSAEDIAALEQRTEGWPAGVQLAVRSLMGLEPSVRHDFIRSFSGSNRFVLSYLLEEVLQQQQPHVRDFLLKTSVLSQLTAPLCSSITGQANSASILAQLVHDNLFTSPLDPDGTWYRYHPLLSESLSARLREDDPALWNELHRRASDWCAHNGHVERAINHAIVSANYELAGELIVQVGEQTWTGGEIATLLRWLDALPPPVIDSRIALRLLYAWVLFLHDRWDDATRQWEDVGRALEQLDEPDKKHCRGRWAAIGAAMAAHRQEADRTLQLTQQSLADLPEDDPNWRIVSNINLGLAHETLGDVGLAARAYNKAADLSIARQNAYLAFASLGHLSEVYMVQGRLFEAQATCERLKQCEELPGGKTLALGANGDIGLALVAYERNDLITAERLFLHALERIWPGGQPRVVLRGRLGLCRLYAAQPAWDKANKQLDLAMVMVTQLQMAAERNLVAATQAWLAHRQGHDIAVTKWKAENQSILQDTSDFRHEIEHRIMAEILIAERRYQAAETLLRALSSAAGRTGRYGRQIAILSLLALALAGQNRADEAESTLKRAISLAEPQGFMRTFIDFGRPLIDLLRRPSVMRAAPSYIKQLLQAYEATIPAELSADKPDDGDEPVLLEKLTPREWEILLLIAAGESNQDIADRLVLSVGTVKGHINHIFSKLDVHSRTAAVAKAHELGLIIL